MNISENIFNKIPLFLKEKYSNIFFDYLRNINQIFIEDKKKNIISFFDLLESKSGNISKNKIYKYYSEIEKGLKKVEKYNNINYSHLELCYLKNKAKLYYRKLKLISIDLNKKIEFCIEYYIKLCKLKVKLLNKTQILNLNNKQILIESKKKFLNKKNITFHFNNKTKFNDKKKIKGSENEKEKEKEKEIDEDLKFDEDEDKNKIINLFIGKFDINKFLNHQQKIELKKGGFVNAFIFKNIKQDDNDDNNNNIIHFKTPIKQKYHNKIFPIKKYNEYLKNKKKNKNYITLESKITNEESNEEIHSKILLEKKINKKLILKNKDNYNFSLSNNQLSYRRNKTTFSSNSTLSNRNKVPSYDFQYTKTTSKILPKIKKSNSKKINHTNLTFTKYNNINLDFLSRKDLYY